MLDTESKRGKTPGDREAFSPPEPPPTDPIAFRGPATGSTPARRKRIIPLLITLATIAVAVPLCWMMWQAYVGAPWTRDGTVRAYVVTIAPEVAGRIVELPVADNQLVRKGDLLMVIDPTNYRIAVRQGEAAVNQAKATAVNAKAESERRNKLTDLAVTEEEKETFASTALSTDAAYQQAVANLDQARVNLERTRIVSPVNGYATNLLAQLGDYVNVGQKEISLIDADSFWIDGYFEETNLERIREGDPASVKLMGYSQIVRGHVNSISRGINVPNAAPNNQGLATVNPIFTWVRLAQRVPVRIHIDQVPAGVVLAAGMTATVQIDPGPNQSVSPKPRGTKAVVPDEHAAGDIPPPPEKTNNSMSGSAHEPPTNDTASPAAAGEVAPPQVDDARTPKPAHRGSHPRGRRKHK